ncbi:MAG TPA: outer membrane lipid asymmetry maintenance protein MlaD [Syntrophorhabdaceae bacterium]|jgi:phospholipid/cholesterol/gamma-HCH transport system substrate-binding protein|nr:outer membrane lipid asymmetry maintenance protein MlaD [Syntrophorhabdaceae bacterium]MDI9562473.1 outer membrane lipid asymmetry maintenance protein MlaD [Pseudomonadota bacterium]MBV6505056.1 putative phospholipid ABC transporter-binding protein MlaD [Syntrophorhabdaceae bacterium]HNQ63580.1 outer membrane lipid asymmetry maintenance protein MlaD [Syntrophorhabdaceae bacterium]HNZ58961.1 outer membrane lipid asymmetry maintenance protein MlaD [Syntrophorhabdaceae bacterium]
MKKYTMETTVGIFVVIGLICVGYMTVKLGKVSFFKSDTYTIYARFASVSALRVGGTVEVYGIAVGSVKSLGIDSDRQMALVGMSIKKDVKIYDDASASIKTSGLIGDKLVKIDPGGSGEPIRPGGIITQTSVPADIEDLIGKYAFGDAKK